MGTNMTTSNITKGELVIIVKVEITVEALLNYEKTLNIATVAETSKKVYKDNSREIGGSLSAEGSMTEAAVEGVAASEKGKVQANMNASWSKISDVTNSSRIEIKVQEDMKAGYQAGSTQIFANVTTTFDLLGSNGTVTEKKYIGVGGVDDNLEPGSSDWWRWEQSAWNHTLGVTEIPESKQITFTFANLPVVRYTWESICRGEVIPATAVFGGVYKKDGRCYVGQVGGKSGKINLEGDPATMHNLWVKDIGRSSDGEILTTSCKPHWVDFKHGQKLPTNAIMNDNGYTWVGRTSNMEIGWISVDKNNDMKNLWTHSQRGAHKSGQVLIIDNNY